MRCPSCGTENAPDSRFCGVCGAKQPGKTAPTAKILDDASYPATGQPSGPASIPPGVYSTGPASIPPPAMPTPAPGSMVRPPSQPAAYGSIPPTNEPSRHISRPPDVSRHSPAPSQQRPSVSAPAVSRAPTGDSIALPPQRPVALIAILLVIDLGLAAVGAVMLAKGLSSDKPAAAPVQKTEVTPLPEAPAPAAPAPEAPAPEAPAPEATAAVPSVPSPAAIATAAGSAAPPPADRGVDAKPAPKTASVAADKSTASRRAKEKERASGPVTSPSGPSDPYTDPAPAPAPAPASAPQPEPTLTTDQEVAKLAASSKAAFDRCTGAAEAHGKIQIAFQVLADGRVANAAAVENSTGNTALAQCLVSTIRGWTLSPHSGSALSFVRPFNYP